jgi:DNA-binding transcriptional LysR family regulator
MVDVNRSGEMEVFCRVVEAGSFSAAARLLNLTPSAVGKLVSRLEERLGSRLLNRSTRKLAPTSEGQVFYDRARRILQDIEEAESCAGTRSTLPKGRLRITATLPFGSHVLVPLLPRFLEQHPQVTVDLSLTDDVVDLVADRTDIAIRIGPLKDSSLVARKLGESRRVIVAAPSYLEREGAPRHPEDLVRHNCLNFNFRRSFYEWTFVEDGVRSTFPIAGNLQVNNGETLRQLLLVGAGLGRLAHFHVADDIRAGRLVPVLTSHESSEIEEIHAIFPGRGQMPIRVRAFLDFLIRHVNIT